MPNNTFTTTGVYYWVAPNGITTVQVEVWAGGGGGGSNNRVGNNSGGGGGGGGYSCSNVAVVAGTNYRGNVGGGGAGGINNNNGANGANSDFHNAAVLALFGIRGLRAGTGGAVSGLGTGDVKFQGGAGAGRTATNNAGGGGAGAGNAANGNSSTTAVGAVGGGGGGNGGNGFNSLNANGNNGETAGGGGAGAGPGILTTKHGGAGANGTVIVTWADTPVTVAADLLAGYGKQETLGLSTAVTVSLDLLQSTGTLQNEDITSIGMIVEEVLYPQARGVLFAPVVPSYGLAAESLTGAGSLPALLAITNSLIAADLLQANGVVKAIETIASATIPLGLLQSVVVMPDMVGSTGRIVVIELLTATGTQDPISESLGVTVALGLLQGRAEQFGSPTTSNGVTVEQHTVPIGRADLPAMTAGGLQVEVIELEALTALGCPFVPDAVFPLGLLTATGSITASPSTVVDTIMEEAVVKVGRGWVEDELTVEIVPCPPFIDVGFDDPLYGKAELFGELVGTDITLEPQDPHEAAAVLLDPTVDAQSPGGGAMGLLQARGVLQTPSVSANCRISLDVLTAVGTVPDVTVTYLSIVIISLEVLGGKAWVGFDLILNSLIAMDAMEAVSTVAAPTFTSITSHYADELVAAGALPAPTVTAAANAELAALSGNAVIFDPGMVGDALAALDALDARGALSDLGEFSAFDMTIALGKLSAIATQPNMRAIIYVIEGKMRIGATAKDPSASVSCKDPAMAVTAQ